MKRNTPKTKPRCSVIQELKYIAESPDQQYGGFHIHAVTTAKAALKEIRRLSRALLRKA